jgi:hypothetical protein
MTQLAFKTVTCAVCGRSCSVTEIISTNQLGAPDLDTRPAEMQRSAIKKLVQVCTGCTYCSADLGSIDPALAPLVYSDEYRAIFAEPCFSAEASYWRCKAYLEAKSGKYAEAFWSTMNAAWDCDDHEAEKLARKSRQEAIDYCHMAHKQGRYVTESPESDPLILMDLFRRTDRWDELYALIKKHMGKMKDPFHNQLIAYQRYLHQMYETDAKTMQDALDFLDRRSMYLLDIQDDDHDRIVQQEYIKIDDRPLRMEMGDIILLCNKGVITHYGFFNTMGRLFEQDPLPENDDYDSHKTVSFNYTTPLKTPTRPTEIILTDGAEQYLYFDTWKKVEKHDQIMIEENFKLF